MKAVRPGAGAGPDGASDRGLRPRGYFFSGLWQNHQS